MGWAAGFDGFVASFTLSFKLAPVVSLLLLKLHDRGEMNAACEALGYPHPCWVMNISATELAHLFLTQTCLIFRTAVATLCYAILSLRIRDDITPKVNFMASCFISEISGIHRPQTFQAMLSSAKCFWPSSKPPRRRAQMAPVHPYQGMTILWCMVYHCKML